MRFLAKLGARDLRIEEKVDKKRERGSDFVQWSPVNKNPDNMCNAEASDVPNAYSDPLPTPLILNSFVYCQTWDNMYNLDQFKSLPSDSH
jgi:hypothetical protein